LRKVIIAAAVTAVGSLALAGGASAANVQQAQVKLIPVSGAKPANGKNVLIDAYLATRDASSTRAAKTASPVGKVFMDFPAGSTVNKSAVTTCNQSEYASPTVLASVCSSAQVGNGWAILRPIVSAIAQLQLTGAAPACADPATDQTQYSRTWQTNPGNGPDCTPFGALYVKIAAYQGGVLKSQWWCFGDNTSLYNTTAACNNKATGGDAKNTVMASGKGKGMAPGSGTFNDTANAKGLNGCNLIFANDNSVAPLSFGGTVTSCKNRLTVLVPALNGEGSGLGELPGGFILSDFYLRISKTTYLKAGKKACVSKKMSVSTQIGFSQIKGESAGPSPANVTIKTDNAC
jgi:hypothetical protein